MLPGHLDVFLLNVASAGYDHRLGYIVDPIKAPKLIRELITVHLRHANVGENETVDVLSKIDGGFDLTERLLAIISAINFILQSLNAKPTQFDFHAQNVVWFVIHD